MKNICSIIILFYLLFSLSVYAQKDSNGVAIDSFVVLNKSKIYYHQKGKGNVPIVFVSGLGEDHNTWQTVQDSVSAFALTLSYDRSGLGRSEYNNEKKDLLSITNELNKLIKLTKLVKPVIIVGHSLGCQVVKEYALLYPSTIKAIVFIDPGYNEEILKARVSDSLWQKREKALKQYLPEFNIAQKEELKYVNRAAAISDSIKLNTKIPVVLFTATKINPEFPCSMEELKVKEESHNLWLKSMPSAIHKIVPESRHYIQNDMPSLIIQSIHEMLLN
jgi:pimeloyl-ACP methyl ester carboxylesterase